MKSGMVHFCCLHLPFSAMRDNCASHGVVVSFEVVVKKIRINFCLNLDVLITCFEPVSKTVKMPEALDCRYKYEIFLLKIL